MFPAPGVYDGLTTDVRDQRLHCTTPLNVAIAALTLTMRRRHRRTSTVAVAVALTARSALDASPRPPAPRR